MDWMTDVVTASTEIFLLVMTCVILIADERGLVRVSVDTGVVFQVLISYQTLYTLDIKFGERIWVNFKANAVVVF
jgi:hypothetical protein